MRNEDERSVFRNVALGCSLHNLKRRGEADARGGEETDKDAKKEGEKEEFKVLFPG